MQIALKNFSPGRIPTAPGLYFFLGPKRNILYVGKAANLRERVRSYFAAHVSEKIERLRSEAVALKILPLASEIEALVKEAAFIKRRRPKYNVLLRDDKNYFFAAITEETFPRIFITHQPKKLTHARVIGPFVSGRALRSTLRLIRRIFPYCTCPKPHRRICLQEQLGLCPGYCCRKNAAPSAEDIRRYRRGIAHIETILRGKNRALQYELERNLRHAVREKRFEDAALIRDKLRGLTRILEHRGVLLPFERNESPCRQEALAGLRQMLDARRPMHRIECYDASVISGTHAVGAMTVFVCGRPEPSAWRLFRMRRTGIPNDPAQIEEMVSRRLLHREWPLPDLMLIDGGAAQLAAARRALGRSHRAVSVAAIAKGKAKRERLLWGDPPRAREITSLPHDIANMLLRIRDATHRFSLSYHRRSRRKSFLRGAD